MVHEECASGADGRRGWVGLRLLHWRAQCVADIESLMLIFMSESEKPNSKFRHLYAVLRIDLPVCRESPENSISVVKVFHSKLSAEQEVDRLNRVNSDKGCRYVSQTTRLVPPVN